jgi:hypothetical protein
LDVVRRWLSTQLETVSDRMIRASKETGHEIDIGIEEVHQFDIILGDHSELAEDVAFPKHFQWSLVERTTRRKPP